MDGSYVELQSGQVHCDVCVWLIQLVSVVIIKIPLITKYIYRLVYWLEANVIKLCFSVNIILSIIADRA